MSRSSVVTTVDRATLASGALAGRGRGPRRDWYRDARVRAGVGPGQLALDEMGGWLCFPEELAAHVAHPAVRALGEGARRGLLRRALARYLHATSVLEIQVVNVVLADVAHGALGRDLPAKARLAALQLTCDEGYHAVVASDLLGQLGEVGELPAPAFVGRLGALCERHARDGEDAAFVRFLFTVVTETVISASMQRLARSPVVLPAVREFVLDHARDEAHHGAYFSGLFAARWGRLSEGERARYGALFAELVTGYLAPDTAAIEGDLRGAGLGEGEAGRVVGEVYSDAVVRASVRQAAQPVIGCLRRAGALAGEAREGLARAGVVEGAV